MSDPPPTKPDALLREPNRGLNWTRRKPSVSANDARSQRTRQPIVPPLDTQAHPRSDRVLSSSSSSSSVSSPQIRTMRSPTSASSCSTSSLSLDSLSARDQVLNVQSAPTSPTGSPHQRLSKSGRKESNRNNNSSSNAMTKSVPPITDRRPFHVVEVITPSSVWTRLELTSDQIECPRCTLDIATVPLGYWNERHEIVLGCTSLLVDKKHEMGYRICGARWTPSERIACCPCDAVLDIECHDRRFVYVCPGCHSVATSSRRGDTLTMTLRNDTNA